MNDLGREAWDYHLLALIEQRRNREEERLEDLLLKIKFHIDSPEAVKLLFGSQRIDRVRSQSYVVSSSDRSQVSASPPLSYHAASLSAHEARSIRNPGL